MSLLVPTQAVTEQGFTSLIYSNEVTASVTHRQLKKLTEAETQSTDIEMTVERLWRGPGRVS